MDNACVAFNVLKGVTLDNMREGKTKLEFKHVRTHMVFVIKMDSKFILKYRLVAGSHNTAPQLSITYYSDVIR